MGVAYYIVLDNDEPDFDTFVNGKAVAHEMEALDALCDSAGLVKIDVFFGQSAEDFSDLLGEEIEFPDDAAAGNVWHSADDGIVFFDALWKVIDANRTMLKAPNKVLDDVAEYSKVLSKAKEIDAKWHLALDV